ncbi:hypothetical protein C8R45DRAFT_1157926 [Mycena sanguinolenta]|nr:hypothetical protein C8R45DRAFT_1157926 [Mycena sanguinolenta]
MATNLLLSDLPADVLLSIFAYCDIASMVSVGQTCRYLHALAFDKSVWLHLLRNLCQRLLPSGRYILFLNSYKLECFSVADDILVWTGSPRRHYDPGLVPVCFMAGEENYVDVINLDLRTGIHTSLIAHAPDSDIGVTYHSTDSSVLKLHGCLLFLGLRVLRVLASSRLESFKNNDRRSSGVTVVDSFARESDMSRRIHLKSMRAPLLLPDLPVDIIFSIFACCDIASVVSVAQTCRCLHAVAFEKSVWLVLLRDLRQRCILDRNCTPTLETLSTAEIIETVKRLLNGPQTWSPAEPDSAAVVSTKITLHPAILAENLYWHPKLLRSGRYILCINSYTLECWSVVEDRLVWTYTSPLEDMEVYDFAAEEADADVMIMISAWIVNLDLQTGTHTSLLVAHVPGSDYPDIFRDVAICGALTAVSLSLESGGGLYVIVNWRERLFLVLQGDDADTELHGALIPGHILLGDRDQLHLISSDTLSTHWAPLIAPDGPAEFSLVSLKDIPKCRTIEASHGEHNFDRIYAHESPIRDGHYSAWIYGTQRVHYKDVFLSYRLSITSNEEPRWSSRSALEAGPSYSYHPISITYRGHILASGASSGRGVFTIFSAAAAATSLRAAQVEPPPSTALHIDIAPYSGALTYCIHSSIVIQYYK